MTSLTLAFARLQVRLEAAPHVCEAMAARFRPFLSTATGAPAATLVVHAAEPFQPALEHQAGLVAEADAPATVRFSGAATGAFDLRTRVGHVEEARGLGAVDALVRAALSLVLPADGALLLHGALVADGDRARVFAGESGAGKSTVAHALGAACDELSVLTLDGAGVTAHATPYWQGRPLALPLEAIVCLRRARSSPPSVERLHGARAARALLGNVVRYAAVPAVEPLLFETVARVCGRAAVVDAACPEGAGFLPFVRGQILAGRRAA